jgi:hypothetical protein
MSGHIQALFRCTALKVPALGLAVSLRVCGFLMRPSLLSDLDLAGFVTFTLDVRSLPPSGGLC